MTNLGSAQKESVHVQLEELARVNRIIDELLFLSRADARAVSVDMKEQEPAAFLQAFAQDASALAEHHGRHFSYTHEGDGAVAFGEQRMRQVLLNLLSNAVSASPPDGRITLRSELLADVWRITVDDEGPGLDAEQRSRIFERFVRFNHAGSDDKGSGLGLAICRSIVQLHRRPHLRCARRERSRSADGDRDSLRKFFHRAQDSVRSFQPGEFLPCQFGGERGSKHSAAEGFGITSPNPVFAFSPRSASV